MHLNTCQATTNYPLIWCYKDHEYVGWIVCSKQNLQTVAIQWLNSGNQLIVGDKPVTTARELCAIASECGAIDINPKILTHPHIPKPLHGVAPRSIKGEAWWDKTRQETYASKRNHCHACGVHKSQAQYHKWLEAHECYDIDYDKATATYTGTVALCHSCHQFIHSGRLFIKHNLGEVSEEMIKAILERGMELLQLHGLEPFGYTAMLYDNFFHTNMHKPSQDDNADIGWDKWRMIFEGKEFMPPFETYEAWHEHYSKENS